MSAGTVGILGVGAVGGRVAGQLAASGIASLHLFDRDRGRLRRAVTRVGAVASPAGTVDDVVRECEVVVVATDPEDQVHLAARAVRAGAHAVTTADTIEVVRGLLALDAVAQAHERTLVVGAGFAPGLTCLIAGHLARRLDQVDEVHVAKLGTGGPACARAHHRALSSASIDWRDGGWKQRPGGSGRELVWFPEPVNGADCYRAALPDALLLAPRYPQARRITARMAATRRDRFTAWLPMLTPPHADGGLGAVRVEVRGRRGAARAIEVGGVAASSSFAAATVAATVTGRLLAADVPRGAHGVADLGFGQELLAELVHRGLALKEYVGSI